MPGSWQCIVRGCSELNGAEEVLVLSSAISDRACIAVCRTKATKTSAYIYPLIDGRQLIWADCDTCCCYCTHIFVADMSQAKLHLLPGSGILWSGCNVTEKNYVDPASMHCVSVFATWMFKWIWRDAWWSHESPTHDAVTRPHGAWVRTTRSARIFLNVHVAAIGSLYMRRCAVHTGSTEFFFQCNRTKTCPPIRGSICRRAPPFSTN